MKTQTALKPARIAALLAAMTAACAGTTFAANIAWDGSNSALWSDGLNWVGDSAPANNTTSDIAVFNGTTAYLNQPTVDQFTVRSINGLQFGGASTVATTLSGATGTRSTSGAVTAGATTLTFADASGLQVGQVLTGTGIGVGTFITSVSGNTVTLSRATTGNTADNTTLTATSGVNLGAGGITLLAGTPSVTNTLIAPITLASDQTWTNNTTNRTIAIQGSINLGNNTLTLEGAAGSIISFNGASTSQSITGAGDIIINTAGRASFGSGSGNVHQSTFTGGVTLNQGVLNIAGGNTGNTGSTAVLGTGILTINGGSLRGDGNIAGRPLANSGQVWNANWTYDGNRSIHMGFGEINLGIAEGISRTLTTNGGAYILTLGGDIVDGVTANTFIKAGVSELLLTGDVKITGDTIVDAGTLTMSDIGSFTFYIGENGVNNGIGGTGTFAMNGTFIFDLTAASETFGNSWQIVSQTVAATFGDNFTVAGFTQDNDVWTFGDYTFSESTGLLTYAAIPEPSTYAALVGAGFLGLAVMRRKRRSV